MTEEMNPEKLDAVMELLKVTRADQLFDQVLAQMINAFRMEDPGIDNEFWDAFMDKVETSEIIRRLAHVYGKHYEIEEVKTLIEFYKSPLGIKTIEVTPIIMEESGDVGQQWGQEIVAKLMEELDAMDMADAEDGEEAEEKKESEFACGQCGSPVMGGGFTCPDCMDTH